MTTGTFTFDRHFPLPPDRMWTLLTAPEYREIWSAPEEGKTLTTLSTDFTVDGVDHGRCGPEEAPDFEVKTRWYHIDAPNMVTCTETIYAGDMALGTSLVTYHLTENGTGTDAAITVAVVSFVGPEMMTEFRSGWENGLIKLDALIRHI